MRTTSCMFEHTFVNGPNQKSTIFGVFTATKMLFMVQ